MPACLGHLPGPGHDLPGSPVATHGVDRHREVRRTPHPPAAAAAAPLLDFDGLAAFVPTAVRAHHVGDLAVVHCGHTERAGAFSTQLDARRLRLLDFEVFFLGTAIGLAS